MKKEQIYADPLAVEQLFREARAEMATKFSEALRKLDPKRPETLLLSTIAILDVGYRPASISREIGVSQTTVGRWANGQTIPRASAFRSFVVQKMITMLDAALVKQERYKVEIEPLRTTRHKRVMNASLSS